MYAHITNEVLAASLIALVIVAASGGLFDRELRPRTAPKSLRIPAVLGLVAGLGLLTKFSALFAAAAVGALLGLRALDSAPAERRRSAARALLSFASVVLFVAGWFYARNALQYGNPVIGNWDVESGYAYTQQPGYRTSGFFLQFGAALWHLPERALYSSLWDGLYATAWCDAQAYFLPGGPRAVEPLASAILWLALIPSAAVLLGFLRAAAVLIRGNLDHPFFVPVLTTLWMLSAVVLFALELPFFSTVNAAFLLGLLPAIALFAGLGFEALFASWPRLRGLVLVDLAGLYALILWVFRAEVPTPL